jgi:hypothetical protein
MAVKQQFLVRPVGKSQTHYRAIDSSKRKFMYTAGVWYETCGKCWEPCCHVDEMPIEIVVCKR